MTQVHRAVAREVLGQRPGLPAVQRRAALDPELPGRWPTPPCTTSAQGRRVFAGQRADGFYVDLGSIFDLLDLRPFQNLHLIPTPAAPGRQRARATSTCTRSRCRSRSATSRGWRTPTDPMDAERATSACGPRPAGGSSRDSGSDAAASSTAPYRQVSRLGHPVDQRGDHPDGRKDEWNRASPSTTGSSSSTCQQPELATLLPGALPGRVPEPGGAHGADRADLVAILLTGLPAGIVPGLPELHRPDATPTSCA